tara:strand:- start:612 stop:1097 length:486 start_codon:yes stop_codon:yes gene_type:complete
METGKYLIVLALTFAGGCSFNGHGLLSERQYQQNGNARLLTIQGKGISVIVQDGLTISLGQIEESFLFARPGRAAESCLDLLPEQLSRSKPFVTEGKPRLSELAARGLLIDIHPHQLEINLGLKSQRRLVLPSDKDFVHAWFLDANQQPHVCTYQGEKHDT